MSVGSAGFYHVQLLEPARRTVRQCMLKAIELGLSRDFAESLKTIVKNLKSRPATWGDLLWTLKRAKLEYYRQIVDRIQVEYAVHEGEHVVFIKECRPVLGHPLQFSS